MVYFRDYVSSRSRVVSLCFCVEYNIKIHVLKQNEEIFLSTCSQGCEKDIFYLMHNY